MKISLYISLNLVKLTIAQFWKTRGLVNQEDLDLSHIKVWIQ